MASKKVSLAKPSGPVAGPSPLLAAHAKHLLWDAHLRPEVLADTEKLRALVWNTALYRAMSQGEPYQDESVSVDQAGIYRVASAIEHLRANVFAKTDNEASIKHLAEIGTKAGSTRTLRHPTRGNDALGRVADALADLEAAGSAWLETVQELVKTLSFRLSGQRGDPGNPKITMLLHYLGQTIFELGVIQGKTAGVFPLSRTALYILSNPEWELGSEYWGPESLVQAIDRSIVTAGGRSVEGTDPAPVLIGAPAVTIGNKKRRRRALAGAVDWLCVLLVERAERSAWSRDGLGRARKLAIRDATTIKKLIPTNRLEGESGWILTRILRPLAIRLIAAFDSPLRIITLAGGRQKLALHYAPMSLVEMQQVRRNFLELAFIFKQMEIVKEMTAESPLQQTHRLIAEDGKTGASYVMLATHDRSIGLKDRLWRKEGGDQWRSMNGQAYTMLEEPSEDELMRMTGDGGQVLSARGRAFAQNIGENVLMVVYS